MAIVPRQVLPEVQQTAQPTPYETVRADADSFGGMGGRAMSQVGAGMQNVGAQLSEIAAKEKRQEDTMRVLDAQKRIGDAGREATYGENGFLTRTGSNAIGVSAEATKYWDKIMADGEAQLTDPRQKLAFQQTFGPMRQAALNAAAAHEATEKRKFTAQQADGVVTQAVGTALDNPLDEKTVAASVDLIGKTYATNGKTIGLPDETVKEMTAAKVSELHTGRIERLLKTDPVGALNLYNSVRGQIHGADFAKIESALKAPLERVADATRVEQITGGTPSPAAATLGAASQLAAGGQLPAVNGVTALPAPGAGQLQPATGSGAGAPSSLAAAVPTLQGPPGAPAKPAAAAPAGQATVDPRTGKAIDMRSLVTAAGNKESRGDPNAQSERGAAGLMQIMPETAREISAQLGDGAIGPSASKEDIQAWLKANPAKAVLYGGLYYQKLLKQFGGDVEAAIIGYNGGPARAQEWLKRGRDDSFLPKETVGYRDEVLANYGKLQAYYGGGVGGAVAPLHTRIEAGQWPKEGAVLSRDAWPLKFYKASDMLPPNANGGIDARSGVMADMLGQRFFEATGIRVGINDEDHGQGGTNGRRRGLALKEDNPHVPNSQHLFGRGFDFQVQGLDDSQKALFLQIARNIGFTGVGFYEGGSGHLHLDTGAERAWGKTPAWAVGALANKPLHGGVGSAAAGTAVPGSLPSSAGQLPLPPSMQARAAGLTADGNAISQADTRTGGYAGAGAVPMNLSGPFAIPSSMLSLTAYGESLAANPAPPGSPDKPLAPPPVRGTVSTDNFDPAGWRAAVAAEPDIERRTRMSNILEAKISRLEKQQKEMGRQAYFEAYRYLQKGGDFGQLDPETLDAIGKHDPRLVEQLEKFDKRNKDDKVKEDDFRTLYHLTKMPDAEFKTVDLENYAGDLKGETLKQLAKKQQELIEADKNGTYGAADTGDRNLVVNAALARMGIDTKTDAGTARAGLLQSRLLSWEAAYKAQHKGVMPNIDAIQKQVDQLTTMVNAGNTFGGAKYLFEMGTQAENEKRAQAYQPALGGYAENAGDTFNAASDIKQIPTQTLETINRNWQTANRTMDLIPKADAVRLYNEALTASTGRLVYPPSTEKGLWRKSLVEIAGIPNPSDQDIARAYTRGLLKYLQPAQDRPVYQPADPMALWHGVNMGGDAATTPALPGVPAVDQATAKTLPPVAASNDARGRWGTGRPARRED